MSGTGPPGCTSQNRANGPRRPFSSVNLAELFRNAAADGPCRVCGDRSRFCAHWTRCPRVSSLQREEERAAFGPRFQQRGRLSGQCVVSDAECGRSVGRRDKESVLSGSWTFGNRFWLEDQKLKPQKWGVHRHQGSRPREHDTAQIRTWPFSQCIFTTFS